MRVERSELGFGVWGLRSEVPGLGRGSKVGGRGSGVGGWGWKRGLGSKFSGFRLGFEVPKVEFGVWG